MVLSISGMGSGIDTATVVSQLMEAESATQTKLTAAKSTVSIKAGAWTTLGNLMTSLQDKAKAIDTADKLQLTSSTSSDSTRVGVTASSTAAAGSLTFSVEQLATRGQKTAAFPSTSAWLGAGSLAVMSGAGTIGATGLAAGDAGVTGKYTVVISDSATSPTATVNGEAVAFGMDTDGTTPVLTVGGATLRFAGGVKDGTAVVAVAATAADGGTLSELSAALQSTGGPATSSLLDVGSGTDPVRLILTASQTGTKGDLLVDASDGLNAMPEISDLNVAQDAKIALPGGLTVTRSDNSVTDVIPGVTLDLLQAEPGKQVTVSVKKDDDAVVSKAKSLTEMLNTVLSWVRDNSKYNVATSSGGPMVGDSGVRNITNQIFSATSTSQSTGAYRLASQIGLTSTREGNLVLDETALRTALTDDPEAVNAVLSGVAGAVSAMAKSANEAGGVVHTGKASTASATKQLQDQIDGWDLKLTAIKARYDRQFAALDVAMSKMNSQSSWLASQIESLPSYS